MRRIGLMVVVVLALVGVPPEERPQLTSHEATPTGTATPDGGLARTNVRFGAGFGYIDLRSNYGCSNGGVVLGEVDASQPFWMVTHLAQDGLATELKVVATAWT